MPGPSVASRGPIVVQTGAFSGFIGSGIDHEGYGDRRSQHFGWHGKKIAPTDFEIAVAPGPLTALERRLPAGGRGR